MKPEFFQFSPRYLLSLLLMITPILSSRATDEKLYLHYSCHYNQNIFHIGLKQNGVFFVGFQDLMNKNANLLKVVELEEIDCEDFLCLRTHNKDLTFILKIKSGQYVADLQLIVPDKFEEEVFDMPCMDRRNNLDVKIH